MSQDFLSQAEVDRLLKGLPRDEDEVTEDDWVDAMSATEVFETERKVRYPEDGEKLTRVEVVRMLNGMTRIAEDEARIAEVKAASYRHALNILEAME